MTVRQRPCRVLALLLLSILLLTGCGEAPEAADGHSSAGAPAADNPASEAAVTQAALPAESDAGEGFRTYDAETFFMTTSFGAVTSAGHAFSPDGSRVLANSDGTGVFNVVAFEVDGSARETLTDSTTHAIFGLGYFPGDERLLYTFDEGGDELNHVYVRETDGTTRDLTPGEKVKASFFGWTADGAHFFVATTERDGRNFDLYRYAADGYARERVFVNDAGWAPSAVSPDGRWLALDKPRTSADSDIYVKDLTTGAEPVHVTPHEGNVSHATLAFGPASEVLYYLTNEHGEFAQAWAHELASGTKRPVIEADWDVQFLTFSPGGRYRVHGINADARTELTVLDTESGEPVELPALPAGDIASVRFSADASKMAFFLTSDIRPADLFVVDLEADSARRLTDALNPAIDLDHLVESDIVRYESFDGLEIPSVLYRPKQASAENPVPALVWVHGGPGGQSRVGYSPTIQHLVNHGYAILAANNRGSSGYGKTFFHLDDRRHGEEDLRDIVEGKRYLAGLDWVDGERIGVIGGSYGGYMTAAALAFHPEVFDVGINIFGVTNWLRTLESIPPWWASFKEALYDEMGDPATDAERHRAISPLFHADQIEKPLLVVQGANDPRVLQVESDELVAAVQANEVPVEYVVFEDEGHGFRKRENRIEASEAYLSFLDRYLRSAATAAD